MNTYQAALFGFLASVGIFYLISVFWGGKPSNVSEFFHDASVPKNIFSLVAANFALGTGVVYVLEGTEGYGLLYLTLPAMLFLGQLAYSRLTSKVASAALFRRGMVVGGLSDSLDRLNRKPVYFQQFTTSYVIITYIISLCYELLVSAKWLSITMFPTPGVSGQVVISFVLLALTMSYTITGGYRTVQRTDICQVICAISLISAIIYFLISRASVASVATTQASALIPTAVPVLFGFATMALTPFTAQLYGILNHSFASHQTVQRQQSLLFKYAGPVTFCVYLVLAVAALYFNHRIGGASLALSKLLAENAGNVGVGPGVIAALAAIGMGAVVMSTVDTMMISVTQAGFEGYFGGDSKAPGTQKDLTSIRNSMLLIYPAAFVILVLCWWRKPDTLGLLFAVASPCEAIAPMIVSLIILAKRRRLRAILKPIVGRVRYLDLFYVLLPVTFLTAFVALYFHSPWSRAVGFAAFLTSSALALAVLKTSSK